MPAHFLRSAHVCQVSQPTDAATEIPEHATAAVMQELPGPQASTILDIDPDLLLSQATAQHVVKFREIS